MHRDRKRGNLKRSTRLRDDSIHSAHAKPAHAVDDFMQIFGSLIRHIYDCIRRHFYVRQLRDMKLSANIELFDIDVL